MALLFLDSFDHYQLADLTSKWTRVFPMPQMGIGMGRCGGNCIDFFAVCSLVKGLSFAGSRATIGFAAWVDSGTMDSVGIALSWLGNTAHEHVRLQTNPDGSLQVMRERLGSSAGDESLGLTPPGLINYNHWYFIEWQVYIHPTAGEVIVRLNNTPVITVSGINTVGDGAGDTLLRRVIFSNNNNSRWRLDDVYVLDDAGSAPLNTFLGDSKVEYLRPRAAGAYQQWDVVGSSGSHWLAVDDNATPDEDATYVESVVPGQIDVNKYQPTGLPSGPIFGAQLSLYARKSEIGPRVIAPIVAGVEGPPHLNVSFETYQYHHTPYGTNPATGLPWTIAEINEVECGVKVVS